MHDWNIDVGENGQREQPLVPNWILKALLDDKRNPLRDLPADGAIHKLLRTQMHLKLEPEKDNIGPQTFQSDRSRLAE